MMLNGIMTIGMNYVAASLMIQMHPVDAPSGAPFGSLLWQQDVFWLFYVTLKVHYTMQMLVAILHLLIMNALMV